MDTEAPDLRTAESHARIMIAKDGVMAKLLCVREADAQPEETIVPDPERRAKIKRPHLPEFK